MEPLEREGGTERGRRLTAPAGLLAASPGKASPAASQQPNGNAQRKSEETSWARRQVATFAGDNCEHGGNALPRSVGEQPPRERARPASRRGAPRRGARGTLSPARPRQATCGRCLRELEQPWGFRAPTTTRPDTCDLWNVTLMRNYKISVRRQSCNFLVKNSATRRHTDADASLL